LYFGQNLKVQGGQNRGRDEDLKRVASSSGITVVSHLPLKKGTSSREGGGKANDKFGRGGN